EDDEQKTQGAPQQRPGPAAPDVANAPAPERVTPSPAGALSLPDPAPQREECTTPLPPARRAAAEGKEGVLVPALVVGLGRLGMGVLRQLRQQVHDRFGGTDPLPQVRLLYLDTDPEATNAGSRG